MSRNIVYNILNSTISMYVLICTDVYARMYGLLYRNLVYNNFFYEFIFQLQKLDFFAEKYIL